ncbi:unnamed protein product [Lactuca saligna]|uniref:Uncharacterized protein n=1 Tax=Lactuca saligna TaxID=75948 RepID=A0AA36E5X8_LACSI|nr:unnamed protein product [Lactuca saligna]
MLAMAQQQPTTENEVGGVIGTGERAQQVMQCFTGCGQEIIGCGVTCTLGSSQSIEPCFVDCGLSTFVCMNSCVQPPAPPSEADSNPSPSPDPILVH